MECPKTWMHEVAQNLRAPQAQADGSAGTKVERPSVWLRNRDSFFEKMLHSHRHSMNASPDSLDAFERIRARIAASRFLTFSLLIHAILVLLAGSIVLYRVADHAPDFEADNGGLVVDAGVAETPR